MADFLSIKFDDSALQAKLTEIGGQAKAAVRPAAQAGAQVLYDQVKANVGLIGKVTGNLDRSIYQVYSNESAEGKRAVYHVSWNKTKAPHGYLVEYGHIQTRKVYIGSDGKWYTSKTPLEGGPKLVAARPFLRPAFDAKNRAALEAARDRFVAEVEKVL